MHKKILIAVFAFILLFFPLYSLFTLPTEERPFSENENRYLAAFPKISFSKIMDKSFMTGFESWSSDMFAGREIWIQTMNGTEQLLGKKEINDVFISDNMLIQKWDGYNKNSVQKNLDAMNFFGREYSEIPMFIMLAPTSQEIYPEYIPYSAITENQKSFIKYVYEELTLFNSIDVTQTFQEHKERYIFYRTDHHWTSLGAYLAYLSSATKMNFTPIDLSDFNIEHASNSFKGTLFSKTLNNKITPDTIDYYTLSAGDPVVSVEIQNGDKVNTYDTLYFREYLEVKDKYSSFMGSNSPIMNIHSELIGNTKKLLIFKDSYAHCLIPFYTKNYSEITVVDMRYINTDYREFITVSDYDEVLFVYNVITFSEDTNLVKLGS